MRAEPGDENAVLSVLDTSIEWLRNEGYGDQWGSEPFSTSPRRRLQATRWVSESCTLVAGSIRQPRGVITLGRAPDYVDQSSRPEVYVELLATNRRLSERGLGRSLLDRACEVAATIGAVRMRVDCYAGNGGRLQRFYESCGYQVAAEFTVGGWPGVVLEYSIATPPRDSSDRERSPEAGRLASSVMRSGGTEGI